MFEKIKEWWKQGRAAQQNRAFLDSSLSRDLSEEIDSPTRSYGVIDPLNDVAGTLHPHRHDW